jgi:hypothetical protein
MAISRAQLLKEILPGLNTLFNTQYYGDPSTWFKDQKIMNRPHMQEVQKVPLPTLLNIWLALFGETVTADVLLGEGVVERDAYMGVVGEVLATRGHLHYDANLHTFTLTEEPQYAHPRQQSRPL